MIAPERDYLVATAAATKWFRDNLIIPLEPESLESLARAIVDAIDDARARRQQEH
jgi:hypothetical protein